MRTECASEQTRNDLRGRGPYSGVDAPLSLRFETRKAWPLLNSALGVDETGAAIVMSAYAEERTAGRRTSYSRSRDHYSKAVHTEKPKWQLRDSLYSVKRIVPQVDHLAEGGWLDHDRAPPGRLKWQSTIRPTPALMNLVDGLRNDGLPFVPCRPSNSIVLRDEERQSIAFKAGPAQRKAAKSIEEMNEAFRGMRLEGTFPACAIRIYNESFHRGGRHYLEGGGVQLIPEARRLQVTFDGEAATEVDWKTLHPSMLYADVGVAPPADCYDLDGWPRDLVKVALLVLVNANDWGSAMCAIAHDDKMEPVAEPGSWEAKRAAGQLVAEVKRMHRPIQRFFHSGMGAFLMRRESDMADEVMSKLRRKGIAVLPIFDSFLGPRSCQGYLSEAMDDAAKAFGYEKIRLEAV